MPPCENVSYERPQKFKKEEVILHQAQDRHYQQQIVKRFKDESILAGHFVSSPRDREKRDRSDSREAERKGQGRKRKINESESEETIPPLPLPAARIAGLARL